MKKPATTKAWKLRTALQALAERGVDGEMAVAKKKLERLEGRYDFSAGDPQGVDMFAGVFHRSFNAVPVATIPDMSIAAQVKWAIECRTGIPCIVENTILKAEATVSTAKTLEGIAGTIAGAYSTLWQSFEKHGGLSGDRNCFFTGLLDGIIGDERQPGQPLPARTAPPRIKRKGSVPQSMGVHPYTLAAEMGKKIRFSLPLEKVENELTGRMGGQLPDHV
jgi:hypothetical protein